MRTTIVIVAVFLGLAASRFLDFVPFKRQLEVTVVELYDIPRTCVIGFPGRERTNPPAEKMFGYCGAIYTDLGLFAVRRSSALPGPFSLREGIIDGLKEGCRYRIWVNLIGRMPNPQARLSNRITKTIYHAEPVGGCGVDAVAG